MEGAPVKRALIKLDSVEVALLPASEQFLLERAIIERLIGQKEEEIEADRCPQGDEVCHLRGDLVATFSRSDILHSPCTTSSRSQPTVHVKICTTSD